VIADRFDVVCGVVLVVDLGADGAPSRPAVGRASGAGRRRRGRLVVVGRCRRRLVAAACRRRTRRLVRSCLASLLLLLLHITTNRQILLNKVLASVSEFTNLVVLAVTSFLRHFSSSLALSLRCPGKTLLYR